MRVGSVSSISYQPRCCKNGIRVQYTGKEGNSCSSFKGSFGKIVGGTLGTGAVVAASFVAAPAIICLAGAGLVAGIVAGDVAEDKINKNDKKNDD